MNINTSEQLFSRAQTSIPGGVNSPVRAFKSVGGTPIFMQKAKGAYLFDADNNKYIDYINSWGPMIMGHAFEPVVEAADPEDHPFAALKALKVAPKKSGARKSASKPKGK